MFWLNAPVMRSLDPRFQIAENKMDRRQVRLCFIGIATKRQRNVAISLLRQLGLAGPSVGSYDSSVHDIIFDKSGKRFGATVRHNTKPQASRRDAASVNLAVVQTRSNLNGPDYNRFVMLAPAFSARLAADVTFINFNRILLAANSIAFRANHARAKLMKYLKGRLVASEAQLALKLNGGLSGGLCSYQVRSPKTKPKAAYGLIA